MDALSIAAIAVSYPYNLNELFPSTCVSYRKKPGHQTISPINSNKLRTRAVGNAANCEFSAEQVIEDAAADLLSGVLLTLQTRRASPKPHLPVPER